MGDWYKITRWSGKAVGLTHKKESGAETRHSRLAILPTPEPVTSSPAETAYSKTGSGRNNSNVPWENIRLAEESNRCLFMCGREKPGRRCSQLISCCLTKLGTTFAFTERSRARRGCRKICTHIPAALKKAIHPERKAYAGDSSSGLVLFCFKSGLSWRSGLVSKMSEGQAWEL